MKRKKANDYPRTEQVGSSIVRITKTKNRGRDSFVVSYVTADRGRIQQRFTDEETAIKEAKAKAASLAAGDLQALKLTGADRSNLIAAEDKLRACGVSVLTAASAFADAFAILGHDGIVEAARFYKERHQDLVDLTVAEAVAKYRAVKEKQGLSPKYVRDIRVVLTAFEKAFRCRLASVQRDDILDWLNGLGGELVVRNNRRRILVGFFAHAKESRWISQNEQTAAERVPTWKPKKRPVDYFSPTEAEALLRNASKEFLPWVLLIGWAGVRREELAKGLDWSHVNLAKATLTVPEDIAKTGKRRKIPLAPNVVEWLANYRNSKGPICALKDTATEERISALCTAAKVKWRQNSLRHSFGCFAMEREQNAGKVSLWMGNSAGVVLKHYHDVVESEDAAEFWDIRPGKPANVLTMEAKVA